MSTILKALRRLEEDGELAKPSDTRGLDPKTLSTDALRGGILAEEQAAEALSSQPSAEKRSRTAAIVAASLAGLVVLAGVGYGLTALWSSTASEASTEIPVATQAEPTRPPIPESLSFPPPIENPQSIEAVSEPSGLELAEVRPTHAVAGFSRSPSSPREPQPAVVPAVVPIQQESPPPPKRRVEPRSEPTREARQEIKQERKPIALAAPEPARAKTAVRPRDLPNISTPAPVAAEREALSSPDESSSVSRIDRRGLADVSVERTSWHPKSDRRSAKVRVGETGEVLSLGEGDSVGGMVIREITPSSVLFDAGGVEFRRRVGSR